VHIFATGMHLDAKYGYTVHEIEKCGFGHIYTYANHEGESFMDLTLASTIQGFANYIHSIKPDLIVVHGDRIEALAGASVGALNNILVAHIEGGELSGTVDELIRHAVSKLSHTHFAANEEAKARLLQMGETPETVFVIGSPDMDVMLSDTLPPWEEVKAYYQIPFDEFAVSIYHPVTTEIEQLPSDAAIYRKALEDAGDNFVCIYPNNDKGSDIILSELKNWKPITALRYILPCVFEYFLVLLKHARYIVGNSSAGLREAPYYGVPTVNIGTRQQGRSNNPDIIHTACTEAALGEALRAAKELKIPCRFLFGSGKSDIQFHSIVSRDAFWQISPQKLFSDAAVGFALSDI